MPIDGEKVNGETNVLERRRLVIDLGGDWQDVASCQEDDERWMAGHRESSYALVHHDRPPDVGSESVKPTKPDGQGALGPLGTGTNELKSFR